jgi:hypothetical protein
LLLQCSLSEGKEFADVSLRHFSAKRHGMQIFFFFWIVLTVAIWLYAIVILLEGEVELKSRFFWITYRRRFLRGKPAYLYAACHLIASSIMLSALSLYPIFGIDTGYFSVFLCSSGIIFYLIASVIAQKYEEIPRRGE